MTTVSYWATDVEAATAWYTELLGVEPYCLSCAPA
jgi:catechol 2,3-dioxygenase-like lactoylglutathione lyase family enzyme